MATQFPEHRTPASTSPWSSQGWLWCHPHSSACYGRFPVPACSPVVMPTPPGPSTAYGNYHRIYAPFRLSRRWWAFRRRRLPLMTSSLRRARRHPDSIMDLLAEVYVITHEGPGEDPGWGDPVGEDPPAVDSPLTSPHARVYYTSGIGSTSISIPLMGPIGDPSMVLPPPLDLGLLLSHYRSSSVLKRGSGSVAQNLHH